MAIQVLIKRGSAWFDATDLVMEVRWSGRKGSATRTLQITFLDDDGYGHERTGLDVDKGPSVLFYEDGVELFRGMIRTQEQSEKKRMPVKAYDVGFLLAKNKDTFNFTNATAGDVFKEVCKRFEIPYSAVADTGYVIPELPKPKTSGWDAIADALGLTYDANGKRFYVFANAGKLSLKRRKMNTVQWVLEPGVNIRSYTYSKNTENVKTRIKGLSKEGTVVAEAVNSARETILGITQEVTTLEDTLNTAQMNELVKTMLAEQGATSKSLKLSCTGISSLITGVCAYIVLPTVGLESSFYVEEDTHVWKQGDHSMSLSLKGMEGSIDAIS